MPTRQPGVGDRLQGLRVVLVPEVGDRDRAGAGGDRDVDRACPDRPSCPATGSWVEDRALGLVGRDRAGRGQGEAECRRPAWAALRNRGRRIRDGDLRRRRRPAAADASWKTRKAIAASSRIATTPATHTSGLVPALVVGGGGRAGQRRWRRGRARSPSSARSRRRRRHRASRGSRSGWGGRSPETDRSPPAARPAAPAAGCPGAHRPRRPPPGWSVALEGVGHRRRRGEAVARVERERLAGDRGEVGRDGRPDGDRVGDRAASGGRARPMRRCRPPTAGLPVSISNRTMPERVDVRCGRSPARRGPAPG